MSNGPHRMKGENVDYFSVKEENCLIMRWLLLFLSFLFHYFINEVRKTRQKLLNLQSQKCQLAQ